MDRRGSRLSRRQFVVGASMAGAGLLAGCGRLRGQADQPVKVPRIAYLMASDPVAEAANIEDFRLSLRDLGYLEGHTITIEWRFAYGKMEQLPTLAAELARLPIDVIVAAGTPATAAVRDVTDTIPIVMVRGNLVQAGLASSLAQPGGNVTGIESESPQLEGKRLELLKKAFPELSRVAALWTGPTVTPVPERSFKEAQLAAEMLGVQLQSLEVQDPAPGLADAFDAAVREHADALLTISTSFAVTHRTRIVELATRNQLPAMYPNRDFVDIGGLMCYGTTRRGYQQRAATHVDKILKGTRPAELPVERSGTFDFVVNLKTAQALGVTFPREILLQLTEVIQ